MKRQIKMLSMAAVMSLMTLSASADPIGVTVTTTANIPVDTWVDTVVVGAGIEMAAGDMSNHSNTNQGQMFPHLFSAGDSIDIGANSVTNNWAALGALGFAYSYSSVYSNIVWDDGPTTTLQSVVLNGASTGVLGINISNIVADGFELQATVDLAMGASLILDLTHLHSAPAPDPDIEICTLVTLNPDMVSDFSDADAIVGDGCDAFDQSIPVGVVGVDDGFYRLKITNTGDETLTNVLISSPVGDFGLASMPIPAACGDLDPGEMCVINKGEFPTLEMLAVCLAPGDVSKLASVVGTGTTSGITVDDDDPAIVTCEDVPPPVDGDGDGVNDGDDLCANTVIPEGVAPGGLNPNHWALTNDDGDFDTVTKGKGKGPNRSYTIEDTAGCSCEQIIEIQGLGDGHSKHGCSISAMDDWVDAVNMP